MGPSDEPNAAECYLALDGEERLVTFGPKALSLEEMILEKEIPKLRPALSRLRENTLWWIEDDEDDENEDENFLKQNIIEDDDPPSELDDWFPVCKWCCSSSHCPTPPITSETMEFDQLTVIWLTST